MSSPPLDLGVQQRNAAVPAVRLAEEVKVLGGLPSLRPALLKGVLRKVDRLATIRIGSARYSVPAALIGSKVWVAGSDQKMVGALSRSLGKIAA
ncbi:MAG: Mu transposase domain-containing protein [Euzebya sp.]